jgi:hypothetical protein
MPTEQDVGIAQRKDAALDIVDYKGPSASIPYLRLILPVKFSIPARRCLTPAIALPFLNMSVFVKIILIAAAASGALAAPAVPRQIAPETGAVSATSVASAAGPTFTPGGVDNTPPIGSYLSDAPPPSPVLEHVC